MAYQYSLTLIQHTLNDSLVEQRASDGYINATNLCKAAGKRWSDYSANQQSQEFFKELEADTRIPVSVLIQSVRGGNGPQGTWVHPQIAISLGQWLSPKFSVQVSKWVYDWMSGGTSKHTPLPGYIARYIANDNKIPTGYFSILQETTLGLVGPLHNLGFEIPNGWVPDISVGKSFCKWLRDIKGIDTELLPTYEHEYQNIRGHQLAKLYPDNYLAEYRFWFKTEWLPINGAKYFKTKDPSCMQFFDKLPSIAALAQAERK